jgi:phage shock protein E
MKSFLIVVFVCLQLAAFAQDDSSLQPKEFGAMADSLKGVIVDLRTPDELKGGVINGSVQIDYFQKDFEKQIASLDKTKTYFLYCASGGRSGETIEFMNKKGFTKVYHLDGGFTAWKKAGMPVAPYKK